MKTILVIDDEESLRTNLREMLTFENFVVIEAKDGLEGIKHAVEQLPDLIICDIVMPGLNGYAVLRELRSDPRTSAIPLILLTSKSDNAAKDLGYALSADEFMVKPYVFDDLLTVLQQLMEH